VSKKEYDAKEVAQAILKKAEQTIKNSKAFNKLEKADPQNMNAAQSQGLKGIKLPPTPKAAEKPEMSAPKPQAAAKMPKPLKVFMGKREMKKAESKEKGVHQPHFMAGKNTGTSDVGARLVSGVKPSASTKEHAVKEHTKVLNELKAMPKPNLTKANKFETKAGLKGQKDALKMVRASNSHEEANPTVVHGRPVKDGKFVGHEYQHSLAGAQVRRGKIADAKETHKKKLQQLKEEPKPKLTKTEKE